MSTRRPYTCNRAYQYEQTRCRHCGDDARRMTLPSSVDDTDVFGGSSGGICLECSMEKLGAFVPYTVNRVIAGLHREDRVSAYSEHDDSASASFDRAVRLMEDGSI